MSSISHAAAPRQTWIVSAWWDLAYVVVTPLLIVPVVLILVRHWLTPEEVSLAVISFASLGHHLPGFMRAYGDRELFARYRWRFLLCPWMVLGLALLFSPPSILADALGITGTPSYVVADEVVFGAVGTDTLIQKVENARSCGSTVC